jgi:hypothetical protein
MAALAKPQQCKRHTAPHNEMESSMRTQLKSKYNTTTDAPQIQMTACHIIKNANRQTQ